MTASSAAAARDARIERAITELVQAAPSRDPATVTMLVEDLRAHAAPLARSIANIVELVDRGEVDQAIALPALAMACATLCDPRLGDREREAARNEIETLLPLPAKPANVVSRPDVPLVALSRGPRPRT